MRLPMAVPVAKGKPTVPTEAAWEKCCPSRGRSLPPVMGAENTSRDNTAPLVKKIFNTSLGKNPKQATSSFSLVIFNRKVKKAFKGCLAWSDYGVGTWFASIQS